MISAFSQRGCRKHGADRQHVDVMELPARFNEIEDHGVMNDAAKHALTKVQIFTRRLHATPGQAKDHGAPSSVPT
jgi:hypothetical protein